MNGCCIYDHIQRQQCILNHLYLLAVLLCCNWIAIVSSDQAAALAVAILVPTDIGVPDSVVTTCMYQTGQLPL